MTKEYTVEMEKSLKVYKPIRNGILTSDASIWDFTNIPRYLQENICQYR